MPMPTVTFPVPFEQIPVETKRLRDFIKAKQQEISVVHAMLDAIQRTCEHKGARRGSNERDGSWMAECPRCGKSE